MASNANITVKGKLETTDGNADVTLAGTGKLTAGSLDLAGDLTTGSGVVTVSGPAKLDGNVTRTSGAYTFDGDVTIKSSTVITLGGTDKVTLGAALKVGTDTVLTAVGGNVELTPGDGAKLTAAAKKLTLSVAGLTVAKGNLAVAAGAELALDQQDLTITTIVASLVLTGGEATTGAKLTGAGNVVAGATKITGGSDNGWQAVGANTMVAISGDTITGTGNGAILKATAAGDNGVIAVAAAAGTAATLTVTSVSINIETGGNVTLAGNTGSVTATLCLKGGTTDATLVIDSGQNTDAGTVADGLVIGGSAGNANPATIKAGADAVTAVTLANVTIKAANAVLTTPAKAVGTLGGKGAGKDMNIISAANTTKTTIKKGDGILAS
jgi:hypothetical protein